MRSLAFALLVAACGDAAAVLPDAAEPTPDAAVGAVEVDLPPAPADWLILFDRSTSWTTRFDRFEGLKDATAGFLTARGTAFTFAATSFPRYDADALDCQPSGYDDAELAWGTSPATIAQTIVDEWSYVGDSTLGPALAGAGTIATQRHAANPGRSTSIVLLTDAAPNEDEECETSAWDVVAQTAASIHAGGRGPAVHVINVMGTSISPDHPAKLGAIAEAGGGYAAFVNGSRTDVATSARTALDDLDTRANTCTRLLPARGAPAQIRVSSPDGTVTDAQRVTDSTTCQGNAFYVDETNGTLTLCSGPAGIGGFCEVTFWRAQAAGAPTITALYFE